MRRAVMRGDGLDEGALWAPSSFQEEAMHVIRLKPVPGSTCGRHDLDAFAVEVDDDDGLDFRFELGEGLAILWALPAGENEMLRLVLVDAAAWHVDEPELREAPWRCDGTWRWEGDLGHVADGVELVGVDVVVTAAPASYRCVLTTRDHRGLTMTTRAWREPVP